jgi:hypothetical protein
MARIDDTVAILREAIRDHRQVAFTYHGLPRKACPHFLGLKADGAPAMLAYQFGGQSESGPIPEWRCFELSAVESLRLHHGPWHRGWAADRHAQHCLAAIHAEVDEAHAARRGGRARGFSSRAPWGRRTSSRSAPRRNRRPGLRGR